ncbi:MAG: Gfo/Idh/MocA family oxidoreductase [Myxococcales bacterium]|nr:Gfo/Idh/MocA family oxidoreductase [Myxococcales bacterium]
MSELRFLVIGCGSIGKRHIRNLLALGHTAVTAFDTAPDRRAEAEALGVATATDLDAHFRAASGDHTYAALVTTPTRLHVPVALRAAEAGHHLFIEKPVCDVGGPELARLEARVAERDLVSLVGCNLRFHPGLCTAKALLSERAIGRVASIRAEFGQYLPDWHPWEDYRKGYSARKDLGGGVVLDAIHELDYVRWLMGDVTEVAALAGHQSHIEIDTEDTASILMRFASGAFGEVHLDYVQRTYTRSCHIIGDEGTIAWDFGAKGDVRVFTAATKAWETRPGPAGWEANTMYVDELRHFVACLRREATPEQDVAEARRVLDVALAVKRSADERVFVSL